MTSNRSNQIDKYYEVTTYQLIGYTASGQHTSEIDVPFLAVSRDLLDKHPIGSSVELTSCKLKGIYKVMDKMGKKAKKSFDVYRPAIREGRVKCKCKKIVDPQSMKSSIGL